MPIVKFITPGGNTREFHVESGRSLVLTALDDGIDQIVAECGGACSCASCHCYIDAARLAA